MRAGRLPRAQRPRSRPHHRTPRTAGVTVVPPSCLVAARPLLPPFTATRIVAVAAMGGWLVVGHPSRTIHLFDVATGALVAVLTGHAGPPAVLCPMVGGGRLLSTGGSRVYLHHVATLLRPVALIGATREFAGDAGTVTALAELPGGLGRFASGGGHGTIRVWDVDSGACVGVMEGHRVPVVGVVALGADTLASAGCSDVSSAAPDALRVWDVRTCACCHTAPVSSWVVAMVRLRGGLVATGHRDQSVRVWRLARGSHEQLSMLVSRDSRLGVGVPRALLQLADGRLVVESDDRTVRLWEVETGACVGLVKSRVRVLCCQLTDGQLAMVLRTPPTGPDTVVATGVAWGRRRLALIAWLVLRLEG